MDPDAFTASLFKWDLRGLPVPPNRAQFEAAAAAAIAPQQAAAAGYSVRMPREFEGLEDMFRAYGVRYYTAARIAELGFTVSTLLNMKDEELDDMMNSVCQFFRVELLVGERYGIKAAVRAERRRLEEQDSRRRHALFGDTNTMDALSQEGLSEEPVQQEKEMVGSGGGAAWEGVAAAEKRKKLRRMKRRGGHRNSNEEKDDDEDEENGDGINGGGGEHPGRALAIRGGGGRERQREHPFIVTEAGEVARGKKNGLDYLFHLYDQCHRFLTQVQNIAKERGEKCPTKVTNQVFRYAKKEGANYINKPKMRHYVHCYALHCLDEEGSNALRRECKLRGENIGAWRQACYQPVVEIAAAQGWDIDAIFSAHPQLSVWYVPTKLRQLCHAERNNAAASSSASGGSGTADQLPY
ncbi:floricaula/leafy homolog [Argentina anserina]|uniref:floricaula/leafy homolog n=1 Tax=Argentina anserina TaxID=57926 RepID=UPI0021763D3D|nr:floricaula/leafy homolog [Potentilla anserina]